MGLTVLKNTKVAIKEESVPGTYAAPDAGTDYVQILEDGLELTPTRETLDRAILGLGLSKVVPRQGLKSITGSLPVEMKASNVAGAAPEYGLMIESLLGGKRNATSSTTKSSGNTGSVLQIENADITKYSVGDIVVVKETGAYHISPITAVDDTADACNITLLIPRATSVFPASVVVEAFTTYFGANDGHPSFSISKYVEDAVCERAIGCKALSLALEGFTTGQVASFNIGIEGADFDRVLQAPQGGPAAYQSSLPPIILEACIYQNGTEVYANEFTLSVENTLAFVQDTCRGKTNSRITERTVTGTINPYKQDDSVAQFNRFNQSTPFSLFIKAYNPTSTAGQMKESVCFYLPYCVINEIGEGDLDGLLLDTLTFSANSQDSNTSEIYIGFI